MNIRSILDRKGYDVVTASPNRTVLQVLRTLVDRNIGAVVVIDGDDIRGILSERDILRLAVERPGSFAETAAADVMTTELVIGLPDDGLDYVMDVMTRNRIRHLPIVDDGRLVGIVSIGDVVNACRSEVEAENRYLHDYIQGVTA
jgi:CBS domain-containing protein